MPLPYLPGGEAELPAERRVIFATPDNNVKRFNESLKTVDGASFDGVWESGTLNRKESGVEITITRLMLFFSAEADTQIQLEVTGNGWRSVSETKLIDIVGTTLEEVRRLKSPALNTTGGDVRFRITFLNNPLVLIFRFRPTLVERSDYVIGDQ